MKVIQVMPEFGLAGAEIMCENLSAELIKMGIEVIVISLYDFHSAITDRMEKQGIQVIYLGKHSGLDLSMVKKLYKIFKKEKPNVVHTHRYLTVYAIPAALLAGVPEIVHTVHNIAEKESSKFGKFLNRAFFRFKEVIPVALSKTIQTSIVEYYKLPEEKVPVVLNGVPLNRCKVKSTYVEHQPFKILHVGRLAEQKNHCQLLQAINNLTKQGKEIQLTLIGDGPLKEQLLLQVQKLNLEKQINWIKSTDNIYQYMNETDLFVLPSNYEGIPMTLIEAMGTGLPIVASAVGGIPDMIEDGESGVLCSPAADNISYHINKMVDDPELRKRCGMKALQESKRFSAAKMAEEYYKVYNMYNM